MRALPLGAGLGDRTGLHEVVEADDLGLDEALFEVGVDDTRRLRRLPALVDGPGARLLRAGGEVGLQAQRVEADAGELVEPALVLAGGCEQFGGIRGVEVDQFRLQLRVEEHRLRRARRAPRARPCGAGSVSTASSTLKT